MWQSFNSCKPAALFNPNETSLMQHFCSLSRGKPIATGPISMTNAFGLGNVPTSTKCPYQTQSAACYIMSGGEGEPVISYLCPRLSGEHGGAEACPPSSLPHNKAWGRRRKIRQTREGRTSLLKSVSTIFDFRIYILKKRRKKNCYKRQGNKISPCGLWQGPGRRA